MDSARRRARLVLINGAPGSGKSTLAAQLASEVPLALALDIDQLKFCLGGWQTDLAAAGSHARRLAIALIGQQLSEGHDVFVGQYLARSEFIEELGRTAHDHGAEFVEIVLQTTIATLTTRLQSRAQRPDRPEHEHNNRLTGPDEAAEFSAKVEALVSSRPQVRVVDGNGPFDLVRTRALAALDQLGSA